jgi:hypothetical protein
MAESWNPTADHEPGVADATDPVRIEVFVLIEQRLVRSVSGAALGFAPNSAQPVWSENSISLNLHSLVTVGRKGCSVGRRPVLLFSP